jgi:hypothetical protein
MHYLKLNVIEQNMINRINKERQRSMNATPTRANFLFGYVGRENKFRKYINFLSLPFEAAYAQFSPVILIRFYNYIETRALLYTY